VPFKRKGLRSEKVDAVDPEERYQKKDKQRKGSTHSGDCDVKRGNQQNSRRRRRSRQGPGTKRDFKGQKKHKEGLPNGLRKKVESPLRSERQSLGHRETKDWTKPRWKGCNCGATQKGKEKPAVKNSWWA